MPGLTSARFTQILSQLRLLTPAQQHELEASPRWQDAEVQLLARELLDRGWLTRFQVRRLARNRGRSLRVGAYVLLERLGHGAMGQVFKARHVNLHRLTALKLVHPERMTEPEVAERFRREIELAALLDHPNLVHAYDAGHGPDGTYLAMEYVEGTDLRRLLTRCGRLPVARACDYVRQAALGLQHLHDRGLVHRDVKPSNLLVTKYGDRVKITDLGLARLRPRWWEEGDGALTRAGVVLGTLDYVAPEQVDDSRGVDIRADLYALGCTLYQLLTGEVPFPETAPLRKLMRHQREGPRPVEALRPGLPPAVAAVVRRLMAKRPERRYQTPAEAADALAGALAPRRLALAG